MNCVDDPQGEVELRVVIPLDCACRSPASINSREAQIILPGRGRFLNSQQYLCGSDAASECCTEEEKDAIEGLAQLRRHSDEYNDKDSSIAAIDCSLISPWRHGSVQQHDEDADSFYDIHHHHRRVEEEDSACSMIMLRASDATQQLQCSFNSATDTSAKTTGSCRSPPGKLASLPEGTCDDSSLTRLDDEDDRLRPRWRTLADLYAARPLDSAHKYINNTRKLEKHGGDVDSLAEDYNKCIINQTLDIRESARLREGGDDRASNMAPARVLQRCDLARGGHTSQYPHRYRLSPKYTVDHAAAPKYGPSSASSAKEKSKWMKRRSLRKVLDATSMIRYSPSNI